jgi:outer membrane protein assembly factor BamD (BamD/ComL family)
MSKDKPFPPTARDRRRRHRRRALAASAALTSCLALTGCQSTMGKSILARISPRYDESLATGMVRPESSTPGRFLARYLNPMTTPHASASKESKSLTLSNEGWTPIKVDPDPKADAELEAATALYRQGKHDLADPLFVKIAKAQKGKPWGERAQFLLAESYFEQKKWAYANDEYERLIKDYPGTEHLDRIVAREYEIAQKWLANAEGKAKPEDQFTIADAFTGKVPLIDASGHAISALEHVRLHDPTGPLSDDALLKLADHYFAARDYETAATYYDQLVTDHPKSEHLQKAQLASIDSKLKAYAGPEYDGQGLDGAKDMIKQTMATFPERQTGNDKLYHTLDVINDEYAERAYTTAMWYKKTGKVISAEYYFGMVSAKWPKTDWAKKSKVEMASLAKLPHKESLPSKIMTMPGGTDPFSSGGSGGMGGMGTNGGGTSGGMGGNMMGGMGGMG